MAGPSDPRDPELGRGDAAVSLGVFGRRSRMSGLTGAEIVALALSGLWLAMVTVFFFAVGFRTQDDPLRAFTVVLAVFMPLALIWIAAMVASSARMVQSETRRLSLALDAMRQAYVMQQQAAHTALRPSVERKLDDLMAAQKATGAALATFTSVRPDTATGPAAADPAPSDDAPQGLDLPAPADATAPVAVDDFITAMNFPESPDDAAGFRALRRAMQDRRTAQLIQASQDVLTLLSQEGIYMDDMAPDRARPDLWRRFARGERGETLAAIGGICEPAALAVTGARMRQDNIFRDTAHHFLRKFDTVLAEFERTASDSELSALTETRTARAFMLVGRVAGTFD